MSKQTIGGRSMLLIAAAGLLAFSFFVGSGTVEKKPVVRAEVQREVSVVSVLRINESETVKLLTVPDAMLSDPLFDTRCLVYTNKDMNEARMSCLYGFTGRPSAD